MEEEMEIEAEEEIAAEENNDLFDYDKGLISVIAKLVDVKRYISKQLKKNPVLKESLFEQFILRIREEQYTSKLSNIADQFAYRALGTITSEGTSLAFWFVNVSPKLDVIMATDTLELIRVVTDSPGKRKDTKAASGTILARLKALMFCVDLFPRDTGLRGQERIDKIVSLKVNAEAYEIMAADSQKAKRDAKDLPRTFSEVVEKVKSKFGENSKQFIVFSLYQQIPVRDNFGDLEIVSEAHIDAHSKSNYLILKETGRLRVVILDHKTRNLYGDLGAELSLLLSNIIRNYIIKHKLRLHHYLFGDGKKLSGFVKDTFTAVGYPKLTINAIREIYENENSQLPLVERAALARLAGHSLATARANYVTIHAQQEVAAAQEEVLDQTVENQDRITELNAKIDSIAASINEIKTQLKI